MAIGQPSRSQYNASPREYPARPIGKLRQKTSPSSVESRQRIGESPARPVNQLRQTRSPPPVMHRQRIDPFPARNNNIPERLVDRMHNLDLHNRPQSYNRTSEYEDNSSYRSNEGAVASASSIINISFLVMKGQIVQAQVRSNPSLAEFRKVIEMNVSPDVKDYRFIIDSKQLDLVDSHRFDMQKNLIRNGVTIFVLQRMKGGSSGQDTQSYMEIATLIDHIKQQLSQELAASMRTNAICVACQETKKCTQLCCWPICANCFITYYQTTNFNLKCTDCHKPVKPRRFFKSATFLNLIDCLNQSRKMLEYINFQICKCGSLMSNDTMFSKQQCNACGRAMCFFCNKDWDADTMSNIEYTCRNNCDYETKVTYELLPCLEFDPSLKIPSRRTCPKCFYTGAFGGRCKYHDCYSCGYAFCFICLESKDDCQKKYNRTRNQEFHKVQCRQIKEQTYSMFPRIQ